MISTSCHADDSQFLVRPLAEFLNVNLKVTMPIFSASFFPLNIFGSLLWKLSFNCPH